MTEPSLLLLIPAYNEEGRIKPVLREYAEYFRQQYHGNFKIVVVLNGCKDNTLGVVNGVAADFPFISALDFPEPIGKGGALIEGLKLAPAADLVGYVDADGASPPDAFHALVKLMDKADCVIGSRWLPGAVLHQAQPWFRQFASRCFHVVVEFFLRLHVKDTQCPCKVMRRAAVEKVHSSLRIADLAFDVNLLYALKHAGFSILEVPTEWTDKVGSKVSSSLFRSSLAMFLSVVRIRLIYSPFAKWLAPLRPLEGWIYHKLRQAPPRPRTPEEKPSTETNKSGTRLLLLIFAVLATGAVLWALYGRSSKPPPVARASVPQDAEPNFTDILSNLRTRQKRMQRIAETGHGDVVLVARASARFLERECTTIEDCSSAFEPVRNGHLLDMAHVQQPEELARRKAAVRDFVAAYWQWKAFSASAEKDYRDELEKTGVSMAQLEGALQALHTNMGRVNQWLSQIGAANGRWADAELTALDLLATNWGKWTYDEDTRKVRFDEEIKAETFNRLVREVNESRRAALQARQQALDQQRSSGPARRP